VNVMQHHQLGLEALKAARAGEACLFCGESAERRRARGRKRLICYSTECKRKYFLYYQRDKRGSRSRHTTGGRIYFAQPVGGGPIKIGFALERNLKARLMVLQVFCPFDLTVLATIEGSMIDERRLHDRFADLRIRGEWFQPGPELVAFIASTKES
jgi:hypothetical protein